MKRTEYWIRFYAPGSFTTNEWIRMEDSMPKPDEVAFPDKAYAFTLHQREDIIEGGKVYQGAAEQVGLMYYHPSSKVETLAQAELNPNATSILLSNMRCNRWDHIVWSRWGNWPQPFDAAKMQVVGRTV